MPADHNRSSDPTALVLARLLLTHLQTPAADEHDERLSDALRVWLDRQEQESSCGL